MAAIESIFYHHQFLMCIWIKDFYTLDSLSSFIDVVIFIVVVFVIMIIFLSVFHFIITSCAHLLLSGEYGPNGMDWFVNTNQCCNECALKLYIVMMSI